MRQFDVFPNPSAPMREAVPYVMLLSSELLDLPAVFVAPLVIGLSLTIRGVNVPVTFDDRNMTLMLLGMSPVRPTRLRRPLGSLRDYEDAIRGGLNRLFTGF